VPVVTLGVIADAHHPLTSGRGDVKPVPCKTLNVFARDGVGGRPWRFAQCGYERGALWSPLLAGFNQSPCGINKASTNSSSAAVSLLEQRFTAAVFEH